MSTTVNAASWVRRTRWCRIGATAAAAGALTVAMLPTPAQAAVPSLRVRDVTVTEHNAAGLVAQVPVVLSQAASRRVRVQYATVNQTAKAPGDYTAKSGTLVFPAGVRTKFVSVAINGDTLDEVNEAFKVRIFNPTRAVVAESVGVVTINDNDPLPRLSVGDVQGVEGNVGITGLTIPVSLSAKSGRQISVAYSITPGTAAFNTDYTVTPESGTLVFPAGAQTRSVSISMIGDTTDEVPETVNLALVSPVNAAILDGTGLATITDDDGPNITVNNVTSNEGGTSNLFNFTVFLSAASPQTVSVHYATANGTAVAPGDYGATSGTVTFLPGQTARTVTVNAPGDLIVEPNETFVVNLSAAVNGTITDSQGLGTILNDDFASNDEGIAAATFLGTVNGDSGTSSVSSGTQSILLGDADWYMIQLSESQHFWLAPIDLNARVSLTVFDGPPQSTGDIDMQIYRSTGSLVGTSASGGTADELHFAHKFDNANGVFVDPDDSTIFYVKVYGFAGNVMNNYSLTVNGNLTGTPSGSL